MNSIANCRSSHDIDRAVGVYLNDRIRSMQNFLHLIWIIGFHVYSITNSVSMFSLSFVLFAKVLVNKSLSPVSNDGYICNQRNVEEHISIEDDSFGRVLKSRVHGASHRVACIAVARALSTSCVAACNPFGGFVYITVRRMFSTV